MIYTILMREGKDWRQYLLVSDERVLIVHMVPALFGWNLGRVDKQIGNDWRDMSHETILSWKIRNDDGLTKFVDCDIDDAWRTRLVSFAESAP